MTARAKYEFRGRFSQHPPISEDRGEETRGTKEQLANDFGHFF